MWGPVRALHQLPVTKLRPCCRLSSVGGLYPPAVTVELGSNELSLQPHFTSSLSGMLEGGSCPLPHAPSFPGSSAKSPCPRGSSSLEEALCRSGRPLGHLGFQQCSVIPDPERDFPFSALSGLVCPQQQAPGSRTHLVQNFVCSGRKGYTCLEST